MIEEVGYDLNSFLSSEKKRNETNSLESGLSVSVARKGDDQRSSSAGYRGVARSRGRKVGKFPPIRQRDRRRFSRRLTGSYAVEIELRRPFGAAVVTIGNWTRIASRDVGACACARTRRRKMTGERENSPAAGGHSYLARQRPETQFCRVRQAEFTADHGRFREINNALNRD